MLPWLLATAALVVVARGVAWRDVLAALATAHLLPFVAVAIAGQLATWMTEVAALRVTFAALGTALPFGELVVVRGASYLAASVQYFLGHAVLVAWLRRRAGVPLAQGAVYLALVSVLNFAALAGVAGVGLAASDAPPRWLALCGTALLGGAVAYALLLRWRPPLLARRVALAPLFELGAVGHAVALAAWLPYVLVSVAWFAAALWTFDVAVPPSRALLLVPAALVATALPASVQGVGLAQLAAVTLFARYAPPAGAEARVLAASLAFSTVQLATGAMLGLILLVPARRLGALGGASPGP